MLEIGIVEIRCIDVVLLRLLLNCKLFVSYS